KALQTSLHHFISTTNSRGTTKEHLDALRQIVEASSVNFDAYVKDKVFSYMTPEQLVEAYQAGLDIQLHTHSHSMHDFDEELVKKEIEENRRQLSRILGVDINNFRHFCYPSGAHSPELVPVLDKLRIQSSTTTGRALLDKNTNRQFMPRILDGEQMTNLEFEAELCGVLDLMRKAKKLLTRNNV
ncbi:MAG: polysaccharide deacetylase family protein, partial [Legionella sp.]